MTEEQVLQTMKLVCNKIKYKYVNTIYDSDDMFQEAFLMCVDALMYYNGKHPLENFLMVYLRNKLFNFKRDKTTRNLGTVNLEIGEEPCYLVEPDRLKHFEQLVDDRLSVDMRQDYLRMRDGVKIPRIRQKKLYEELRNLATDFEIGDDI